MPCVLVQAELVPCTDVQAVPVCDHSGSDCCLLCNSELHALCCLRQHCVHLTKLWVWVQLHAELMPDGLHPSAAGMEQIFGRCLAPLVDELLQS